MEWYYKQKSNVGSNVGSNGASNGPEHSRAEQKRIKNNKVRAVALPEFISEELWKEFLEHRKNLRKKMTPYAQKLMFKKLTWLKDQGHNPEHLLKDAIVKGWQDVYIPKDGSN